MSDTYDFTEYRTARGLEQILIQECRTLNRNRDYPTNNQINGLSQYNPYYTVFWDAGMLWASENEISCN